MAYTQEIQQFARDFPDAGGRRGGPVEFTLRPHTVPVYQELTTASHQLTRDSIRGFAGLRLALVAPRQGGNRGSDAARITTLSGTGAAIGSLADRSWKAAGHTSPMTYVARNGKQYVIIVSSGINAFALE